MTAAVVQLAKIDAGAVETLLDAAFGGDRHGRTAYRLRDGMGPLSALSFAVLADDALVGTIQCWPVEHRGADGIVTPLVMVGPVAVRPDHQGAGLGRVLMNAALAAARTRADGPLAMIGDPDYYGRFWGFSAAGTRAWDVPGPVERHRLLARPMNGHRVPDGPGTIGPRRAASPV